MSYEESLQAPLADIKDPAFANGIADDPPPYENVSSAAGRSFAFTCKSWKGDTVVKDESSQEGAYYIRCSGWRPTVTLHAGADKAGPVVGVAELHSFRDDRLGLGDPAQGPHAPVVWEPMFCSSAWTSPRYSFEATADGRRRALRWENAHLGEGWKKALFSLDCRLVDVTTGTTIATYGLSHKMSMSKLGTLRFEAPVSRELEHWIMLSTAACVVKAMLTRSAASAGGASSAAAAGAAAAAAV